MRVAVTRGGPLDLGLYHTDINRSKLTIEMYCSFSNIGNKLDNCCLLLRTLGVPPNPDKPGTGVDATLEDKKPFKDTNSFVESLCGGGVVWSLCVDNEGTDVINKECIYVYTII